MKKVSYVLALAILFAICVRANAQSRAVEVAPRRMTTHPWEYARDPFPITANLYYVGNFNVSAHLIDTGSGLILIDTGFPQTVYLLLESIRRLGFDPKNIVYILHTHGHYDHMGGTRALVELTHAKTAMGKADASMMRDRRELTWAPEYGVKFYETFDVDLPLSDGDTISLGSTAIKSVHTPGHTAGCFSYFFNVSDKGQSYRVGIFGGPGLNSLTDEYLKQHGLPYGAREDYLKSVERLKKEPVDIFLGAHPGPGQSDHFRKKAAMTESKNPFIDKDAWLTFLTRLEAEAKGAFQSK